MPKQHLGCCPEAEAPAHQKRSASRLATDKRHYSGPAKNRQDAEGIVYAPAESGPRSEEESGGLGPTEKRFLAHSLPAGRPATEETVMATCTTCGQALTSEARFCAACGRSTAPAVALPDPRPWLGALVRAWLVAVGIVFAFQPDLIAIIDVRSPGVCELECGSQH